MVTVSLYMYIINLLFKGADGGPTDGDWSVIAAVYVLVATLQLSFSLRVGVSEGVWSGVDTVLLTDCRCSNLKG